MSLYLVKRSGTYYFRRAIPPDVRPAFGDAQEFMFSLHTKDILEAKRKRSVAALQTDAKIDEARARESLPGHQLDCGTVGPSLEGLDSRNGQYARIHFEPLKPANKHQLMLDPTIVDLWAAERRPRRKSIDSYRHVAACFANIINKSITKVTKHDVLFFKTELINKGLSLKNVKIYLNKLNTLFNFACANGKIKQNPASDVRIIVKKDSSGKRLPFSLDDLVTIFSHDVFTKGLRPPRCGGEAAFWIPIFSLFTGARPEELCQLRVKDVAAISYIDEVGGQNSAAFISITEDDVDGLVLKNEGSRRLVPIHRVLIELGFLRYVQSLRDQNVYWVFPDLKLGAYARRAGKWSDWSTEFLRKFCKITDPRKVFYSLRHTFKDLARHCGIPDEIQRQIMGHADRDVADGYGSGYSLHRLVVAMNSYGVPGLKICGCDCSPRSSSKRSPR